MTSISRIYQNMENDKYSTFYITKYHINGSLLKKTLYGIFQSKLFVKTIQKCEGYNSNAV